MVNVLILGGTTEASRLARGLVEDRRFKAQLSFAGRTANIVPPPVPYRVGGFGGTEGLFRYLLDNAVDAVIDATHPFAAQMSTHAVIASHKAEIPLLRLERPAWMRQAGDVWIEAADMVDAARQLGPTPRRVFLPIGKLEIAAFLAVPWHDYLIRAIDAFSPPPQLPHCRVIAARGPFDVGGEKRLLREEGIDIVVAKNSGADATYGKIVAARELGLPVVMVARPKLLAADTAVDVETALRWLERIHGAAPVRRGE